MCISGQFFYMKFFYTIFWSALLVVIGSEPFETNAEDYFASGLQPSSTVDRPSFYLICPELLEWCLRFQHKMLSTVELPLMSKLKTLCMLCNILKINM